MFGYYTQPAAVGQPLEVQLSEGQAEIDGDPIEEPEQGPAQQQDDADVAAWYAEVGSVLWCQFENQDEQDDEGRPLVEYEDLLSGELLDLAQHEEPEHFWYW